MLEMNTEKQTTPEDVSSVLPYFLLTVTTEGQEIKIGATDSV